MTERIDVHHHILSTTYREALVRAGVASVAGSPFPAWSLESTLERMEALGVTRALLSVSTPGVCFGRLPDRVALARELNAEQADLRDQEPQRLGVLASLPLPDLDAALAEIEHAYDVLHVDGLILLTNYDGTYVSDPLLEPVLAELDRRQALVLLHPAVPPGAIDLGMALPPALLEFTFDTTRVAADLILRGTLDRFPNVRWVLAHLGGALPFLAWRLSMIEVAARGSWARFAEPGRSISEQLRRFWYDTAMSAGPEQLRAVVNLVGADRVVFGSDTPFGPPAFVERTTRTLDLIGLTPEEREAVDHRTLGGLLPRAC